MNQSPEPLARRAAKRLVPSLTAAADRLHLLPWTDRAAAAVSMLGGQGAGSGWDEGEIVAAVSCLRGIADPVVVDCGANSGEWTRGLRLVLGSDRGTWVLVEPTEEYLDRLKLIPNAHLLPYAAGDVREERTFYVPDQESGWMTLHERGDTFSQSKTFYARTVQVVRLDEELAALGISAVDFMKIDVEGHELFVLRGLGELLAQCRVRAFTFEFGAANVNSRTFFREFWELIHPAGYEVFRIAPGGRRVRVGAYYETLEFFRGATNYLAIAGAPPAA